MGYELTRISVYLSDCSSNECKYGLISQGEGTWGIHKHMNGNVLSYLFLMRGPVARALSDYYYRLNHEPWHPLKVPRMTNGRRMSLMDYSYAVRTAFVHYYHVRRVRALLQ